jgi:hypothetical protein
MFMVDLLRVAAGAMLPDVAVASSSLPARD